MLIREVSVYYGPNGEKLEKLVLKDAETLAVPTETIAEEPIEVFLGEIVIPVAIQGKNPMTGKEEVIGVRPQEMKFPIEATSVKEAYDKYQAAAQDAVNMLKKEQEARQKQAAQSILVPNAAQSEAINKLRLVTE